jgi:hypothetical protein
MDDAAAGAITVVRLDPGTAQRWFDLIVTVHRQQSNSGSGDDWDHFQQQFTNAATGDSFTGDQVRKFLRYLEDNGRLDTVRRLRDIGSELPLRYDELTTRRPTGATVDDDGPDDGPDDDAYGTAQPRPPSRWDTVVQRFGPGWAAWDGSADGWTWFRDWTYATANAEDPQLYAAAYERLDQLNSAAPAERIARLREFGFTVNATPPWAAG